MRTNPPLKAIELFCGSGGMSIGLSEAGFDVTGVELDPYACATHREQVGPALCMDVRNYHPPRTDVDLVAAGSPCKSFSRAGRRRALDDDRGKLIFEFARVCREARSRAFLFENVRDILTIPAYEGKPEPVIDVLYQIMERAGYPFVTHRMLVAADFGTPQVRRRVFMVGFREPEAARAFRWPHPTHGPDGTRPYVTVRQATGLPFDAPAPSISAHEQKAGTHSALTIPYGKLQHSYERMVSLKGELFPKPTPEQYGQLMGYPKGFRFLGPTDAQYQQAGNSVAPQVAEAVGRRIYLALRGGR